MSTNEAQLVDLPEQEEERPKVSIWTPKLVILLILSVYFVGQNTYQYITNPPQPPTEPIPEVDAWENFWALFDRFQMYLYVSVIGFVLLYFLRKSNDKAEEEKLLKEQQELEEAQEKARKLQAEREERIIRKLEQEEREAQERQMRAAQAFASQNNQEHPKAD